MGLFWSINKLLHGIKKEEGVLCNNFCVCKFNNAEAFLK